MSEKATHPSTFRSTLSLLELIYHATVRNVRQSHGNALIGLMMNVVQTLILVGAFYLMFSVLGLRGSAIRGNFLLYILSGIFIFMTQTKAIKAVLNAEGPASPMMQHAPMNTLVAISASSVSALYIQVLAVAVVLFGYHVVVEPLEIHQPAATFGMLLLAWWSGVSIGMVFLALKPWAPSAVSIVSTVYTRANMIASGKMFVANAMPGYLLVYFTWNPLFHIIDQARGFAFINYNPHFSSVSYPVILSAVLMCIGLMGEFVTRRSASLSWEAKR
jgi:ABC-type polysaccharide/polyol phosphate export permease